MRRIKLTQGKWATVDDRFYDALIAMGRWHYSHGYAQRWEPGTGRALLMHRVVMELAGVATPEQVDHKNRRRRDNRLQNLRPATQSQNSHNMRKHQNNTSGVKGVHWDTNRQYWVAQIRVNGARLWLGRFDSKRAAATAYRIAARRYHGEFARAA